jgi:thioredoxin reductase/ferredoxin
MDILMDEALLENIIIYGIVLMVCAINVLLYLWWERTKSNRIEKKLELSKVEGLNEPVSLYPFIDLNTCIGSTACVSDCPEKDILGIVNGKAILINTSNCIGHGACFHACPVEAITLRIGTESRGIDLPHVNENFETNTKGIYIAGELGGMGLIKNSVEQGQKAMDNIIKNKKPSKKDVLDVMIIGAGPAGISASLEAKKNNLSSITLEQDSLGGTVYTFPRSKIVMTSPMNLPLYGKVKLYDTSKDELLQLWKKVINEHHLNIFEKTKADDIIPMQDGTFKIITNTGKEYIGNNVLIAIGRRGSPRKLNVPGEDSTKVAYRLLEPEGISGKNIVVVGGGDSAVESAMLLKENNEVILSYRKNKFARIKPKNREKIDEALANKSLTAIFNSNLVSIDENSIMIKVEGEDEPKKLKNDQVFIFAGGELPTKFLQNAGINITKRFGYIVKTH